MKSRNFVAFAVAALTLGISNAAFAQGPMQRVIRGEAAALQHAEDRRGDRHDARKDRRDDRKDHRADRRGDRRDHRADRREDRRDHRADRRNDRRYYSPPPTVRYQAPPTVHHYHYHARGPEFRRGGYIPREYRNRQYVVVNHHHHRLTAPPRGHHWVQVGGDFVLIAVATGLIAHVILNN